MFCPIGSKETTLVAKGYYSYNSSLVEPDDEWMHNATMSWQRVCEIGYYCENGVRYQCPAGTFGYRAGMNSESGCLPCLGYYCPSEPGKPSTNANKLSCGSIDKYCPGKTAGRDRVDAGYYSLGGERFGEDAELYRTRQEICPKGSYCEGGKRMKCLSGSYGYTAGLSLSSCSGFCPAGSYCEEGTVEPQECQENSYASAGWSECIACNSEIEDGQERCKTARGCCNQ